MQHAWIFIVIATAFMQAVRTAAQKRLNAHLSTMVVTYVRSAFAVPLLVVLLLAVLAHDGRLGAGPGLAAIGWPARVDAFYVGMCAIGALCQILGTVLLVHLFSLRNFAVANVLPKSELIFVACIGVAISAEIVSPMGWAGILATLLGVLLVSLGRAGMSAGHGAGWIGTLRQLLDLRATGVGLASGCMFAICALALRAATQQLGAESAVYRGAWTVLIVNVMQVVAQSIWLAVTEPGFLRRMRPHARLCSFIGAVSGLGSFGWLVAFGLQNASYVRAVGQVEVVFTLLLSALYFRERIGPIELVGIASIVAGVLIFRLLA